MKRQRDRVFRTTKAYPRVVASSIYLTRTNQPTTRDFRVPTGNGSLLFRVRRPPNLTARPRIITYISCRVHDKAGPKRVPNVSRHYDERFIHRPRRTYDGCYYTRCLHTSSFAARNLFGVFEQRKYNDVARQQNGVSKNERIA